MNVRGKKVLITGGSSGIGLATASELALDARFLSVKPKLAEAVKDHTAL